jgi:glyoxylase-like metal-dependent hydrolase (beta-lactamase superfamily II)
MIRRLAASLASLVLVSAAPPTYDVYAVRFAGFHGYPTANLVLDADTSRRQDMAFMVWVMKGPNHRTVLLDAGFYRPEVHRDWSVPDYERPTAAIAKLGLQPADVTDIIISHIHWDHLDGADLFPKARIWIQRDEYQHYVGDNGMPLDPEIDTADAQMLARLHRAGRVTLIDGDARQIIPGITVYTGGRHTYASEYVGVATAAGTVVLASDNAYLYENLESHRPIAQLFAKTDSISNRQAQARMSTIASDPRLIVPGHDPAVFVRFPTPGNGVARIQ